MRGMLAPAFHLACTEGTLGASPQPLTEPHTTVSIFQCDILVEAWAAPRATLALKRVPAGGAQAGVGISHPLRCPGGRGQAAWPCRAFPHHRE